MNRTTTVLSDDRGVTAIEYAIIAALIGIGIVGSLSSTKTSLSGTYNKVATQMASAVTPPGPAQTRAQYWAAKGLSNRSQDSSGTVTFTYADGSQVFYIPSPGSDYPYQLATIDYASHQQMSYVLDKNGALAAFALTEMTPDNSTMYYQQTTQVGNFVNGAPTNMIQDNYDVYGRVTSSTTSAPTADYLSKIANSTDDFAYFKSL